MRSISKQFFTFSVDATLNGAVISGTVSCRKSLGTATPQSGDAPPSGDAPQTGKVSGFRRSEAELAKINALSKDASWPNYGGPAGVQLMRQCWTGETVDFSGEFFQVSGFKMYPTPVNKAIPVVWGGHSDAALKRVARVGDGWHPTQITLQQLSDGIRKLRQYCAEAGRGPDGVLIVARPGDTYDITAETHEQHVALGVDHLVVDTPIKQEDPHLQHLRERMERISDLLHLRR